MYEVVLFCAGSIFGLELWRRSLVREQKIPRWASITSLVGFAIAAGGAAVTVWMLQRAKDSVEGYGPDKASMLARSISRAMNANSVAVAATVAVAIMLGVFALRRRRQ